MKNKYSYLYFRSPLTPLETVRIYVDGKLRTNTKNQPKKQFILGLYFQSIDDSGASSDILKEHIRVTGLRKYGSHRAQLFAVMKALEMCETSFTVKQALKRTKNVTICSSGDKVAAFFAEGADSNRAKSLNKTDVFQIEKMVNDLQKRGFSVAFEHKKKTEEVGLQEAELLALALTES